MHGPDAGGDARVLRIQSTGSSDYYEIRGHGGSLSFMDTKVTVVVAVVGIVTAAGGGGVSGIWNVLYCTQVLCNIQHCYIGLAKACHVTVDIEDIPGSDTMYSFAGACCVAEASGDGIHVCGTACFR